MKPCFLTTSKDSLDRHIAEGAGRGRALHGETIASEALWACTTCRACVHECPVAIDQLGSIIDLRRYLVGEGQFRDGQAAVGPIDASGKRSPRRARSA